jgi:hypothetical protein
MKNCCTDCTAGIKFDIDYTRITGFDYRNPFRDDRQYFIFVSWSSSGFLKIVHKIILMGYGYSFPNSYFL